MTAIINTKLILEDSIIYNGVLTFENGRICDLGKAGEVAIPEGAEIIDAQGLYTAPGLIDIHNHGGPYYTFDEDPKHCCDFFLKHGATTVLPTFYCTLSLEQMIDGLAKIKEVGKTGSGRIMDGLYMEGPYMSGGGSNQKYIRWQGDIVAEEYVPLVEAMKGHARVWAIDPARPGVPEFMKYVKSQDPNAIFANGHSTATFAQCKAVRKLGVKVQTHYNDSGKAPGFAQGTMGSGCDEYSLHEQDMYAELICDYVGIHVDPNLIKMMVKVKGVEHVILISDHMGDKNGYKNNEADGIAYGPDLNYDYEGHLAGSHLTLDAACRNMMRHTGHGLCHVIRMASLNPATLLGIEDRVGSLEVGKTANLILIDDEININTVILEGKIAVQNDEILV